MRFYKGEHRHYCGVDLHTRWMYVCILDQKAKKVVHRNIKADAKAFIELIKPYRKDLVVVAECIFTAMSILAARMGRADIFAEKGIAAATARQGSAFCTYFMDHEPRDWHDLAQNHDADLDGRYRQALLRNGVYHFPMATKQRSIGLAHTEQDIDETLEITRRAVERL